LASRLSSMLVRDGIVGVKRLEKAFRRQVVYGGNLDTVLLEMGLIAEERLSQYLALSSGLPPASRAELPDDRLELVRSLLPETLAGKHRVVPLGSDDGSIRVAVHSPVDMAQLEDLADEIDCALQPLIVPEYRWHVWFGRVYGGIPLERFVNLAQEMDAYAAVSPVGRAQTVIVSEEPEVAQVLPPSSEQNPTLPMDIPFVDEAIAVEAIIQDRQSSRRNTLIGLQPARAQTAEPLPPDIDSTVEDPPYRDTLPPIDSSQTPVTPGRSPVPGVQSTAKSMDPFATLPLPPPLKKPAATSTRSTRSIAVIADDNAEVIARKSAPTIERPSGPKIAYSELSEVAPPSAPIQVAPIAPTRLPSESGDKVERESPLSPLLARQVLTSADDRDSVFVTLLRAARYRTRFAGLLTVQGGAAIGRIALAEPSIDTKAFSTVLIPLDMASPFRTAFVSKQPYVGSFQSADALDLMLRRMGGVAPAAGLIIPVVVRDRVVALVVAHRLEREISLADIADVLSLERPVTEALTRVIMRSKVSSDSSSGSSSAIFEAPAPAPIATPRTITQPVAAQPIATAVPVAVKSDAGDATRSLRGPTIRSIATVEYGTEVSITADEPRAITDVLDEVVGPSPALAEDAMDEAIERIVEAMPLVIARFPGKLRVDRFSVSGRPLRAAQYGGLLELVVRMGDASTELLVQKMAAPQRDIRFYATVCAVELRPKRAVNSLVERLFDNDFGVRACAIEALHGYPLKDLETALVHTRHALHSDDIDRVAAACHATAEIADVGAFSDLLAAMARGERFADHARAAMMWLSRQDFGTSDKKWRKWWEDHRRKHRMEWLIDALGHKEDSLRKAAIDDLRRLTGEYFGFHHDLGKKERDAAQARWQTWWQETGARRFA
jgi:hypothetical protein